MKDQRDLRISNPTQVMAELQRAWARTDWLFDLVPRDRWVAQGILLRHPFLFYIGHLPAFAWNHLSAALGRPGHDAHLDSLFARGIDPADLEEAATLSPPTWPSIEETLGYRDAIRAKVLAALPDVEAAAPTHAVAAHVLPLILEHELMHHETLLYMIRQLDPGVLVKPEGWRPPEVGPAPEADRVEIAAGPVTLGAGLGAIPFGWDNEFPEERAHVEGFALDRVPVTIGQYLRFVEAGGYDEPSYWSEADFAWKRSAAGPNEALAHPLAWRRAEGGFEVRSMFGWHRLSEVTGWPVYVSYAEASAYCRWAGTRLPTEAELHRAAFTAPDGADHPRPWPGTDAAASRGAFDFHVHGRVPVGSRPEGRSRWGVDELLGNGWEWTSTPFLPREGFAPIHPNYPGYSADFFDGEHFVVFGGSWATDARLLRRSFRNWYQRRYPYIFCTFRTAE